MTHDNLRKRLEQIVEFNQAYVKGELDNPLRSADWNNGRNAGVGQITNALVRLLSEDLVENRRTYE